MTGGQTRRNENAARATGSSRPPLSASPRRLIIGVLFLLAGVAVSAAAEDILHLPIGDPARRDRDVPIVLDAITDAGRGDVIGPGDLAARLSDTRILFVGEGHTEMETHRVELRVIEELDRAGRSVIVGLEMFPCTEQDVLDRWSGGRLTEEAFLERSRWYKSWGYPWAYYRDIFLFARKNRLRMVGVNAPRETITAARRKGFAALAEEERTCLPPRLDRESPDQMRLFKASFEGEDFHSKMSEEGWKGLLEAQTTWDAAMGSNAVRALERAADSKSIVVVLLGAGHVQYGLGAERQARLWFSGKTASLLPVAVRDAKRGPITSVRASSADFLWGVPFESDPLYPQLGLSTAPGKDGPQVIFVEKDSPAGKAGLSVSDVLLSFDGARVLDRESLSRLMAGKRWGDAARLSVRRGGEPREVTVWFRRDPAALSGAAAPPAPTPTPR